MLERHQYVQPLYNKITEEDAALVKEATAGMSLQAPRVSLGEYLKMELKEQKNTMFVCSDDNERWLQEVGKALNALWVIVEDGEITFHGPTLANGMTFEDLNKIMEKSGKWALQLFVPSIS